MPTKADEIAEALRMCIVTGEEFPPGTPFLTVREIAGRFSTSLSTAQKVMTRLKRERLLRSDSTKRALVAGRREMWGEDGGPSDEPKPDQIAFLTHDLENPFYGRVAAGVQRFAREEGFHTVVAATEIARHDEEDTVRFLLDLDVAGFVICPNVGPGSVTVYSRLLRSGVPIVLVGRLIAGVDEAETVTTQNHQGGVLVAEHFLELGFDRFGYIGYSPELRPDERLSGFHLGLVSGGAELPSENIVYAHGRNIEHGYEAMKQLVERIPARAVFVFNDLVAVGALQYCREQGIKCSQDVAIAGYDNLPESQVTAPPLTTIAYPIDSMARMAVECLVKRIRKPRLDSMGRLYLEPRLLVRRSTDPDAPLRFSIEQTPE